MRKPTLLELDADEDEEGRDRLPTALKRDIKPAAGGTFSSRASIAADESSAGVTATATTGAASTGTAGGGGCE